MIQWEDVNGDGEYFEAAAGSLTLTVSLQPTDRPWKAEVGIAWLDLFIGHYKDEATAKAVCFSVTERFARAILEGLGIT